MPVHKFITSQRRNNPRLDLIEKSKVIPRTNLEHPPMRVGNRIIVYAQKDMKIGWDPKMITLGVEASIAQTPIFVSLPQELRHRRLGLINSIIAESCDDIIVSIGLMSDPGVGINARMRRSGLTDEPHVTILKGTPLCILMI